MSVLSTTQYVGSGVGNSGSVSDTDIVSGGVQFVGFDFGTGTATNTTIDSGGFQYVGDSSGTGYATSTKIDDGGRQYVGVSGGTGTATSTTISSGGEQIVGFSGGTGAAASTTILSGGFQIVGYFGTGTATDTTINGGVQDVGTGTAISTTINGGTQYVGSGGNGTATNTTINGGAQYVGSGGWTGIAASTTINSGGRQFVGVDGANGTATSTTINSGGTQYVGAGGGVGTATNTTINSGGLQYVGSGGTGEATGTTIFNGAQIVGIYGGHGTATDTTINGGGVQDVGYFGTGTATDTTINSGVQQVGFVGTGTAISTTILSGGAQYLGEYNGTGTAIGTTISGGTQYVGYSGGTGTAIGTTISGGEQIVGGHGTATDTTIFSGGLADIHSGGVANAPVIDGGTLRLEAYASIGTGGIEFAADTNWGTLDLTHEGFFTLSAVISGFTGNGGAAGDVIDVAGTGKPGDHVLWTQNTATWGTLLVEDAGNHVLETLTLAGVYDQAKFVLTDPVSVDQITYDSFAPCYRRGTLIATENGEAAVEDLRVGDRVLTASGALRPIVWIGHRDLDVTKHRWPLEVLPVRVRRNAFGEGLPRRDLWLSPQHAVFVDGVLIPIVKLANGATIAQERVETVSYWHVELESHDLLLAENLPAESFLDCGARQGFANYHGFVELHPTFVPKSWDDACAPLKESGPEVESIHARLLRRALELGFWLTGDPDLRLVADSVRIAPWRNEYGVYRFSVPQWARETRLASRIWRPADGGSSRADVRYLGVIVTGLELDGRPANLATLGKGWHDAEREGWRWTDGYAALPPARRIALTINPAPLYWIEPNPATAETDAA